MTSTNQLITINNDKYLLRKTPTKLILHHLPSLDIVHKHHSEISYFCVNRLQIMLIYKNTLTFLKPKCPPLRLIQYQQDYLDWEPIGGLTMTNLVVLYDRATIAFYYRSPRLEKSWAIDVIQQIEEVKHSKDQKFIALKVKEPKNTIFLWDLNNLSKKPNQQIVLKQTILKWTFHGDNLLLILTETEFKVYFANQETNQHFIQYYFSLPQTYSSFLTLNQFSQTQLHSGRKSVNHVAFMLPESCEFDVVELYDVEKRQSRFKHSQFKPLRFNNQKMSFSQPIAGYEYESKIHILGEVNTGMLSYEPKCLVLNSNFQLQKITQYKQHQGIGLQNIQYQNGYVLYFQSKNHKYKLGKFVAHDGKNNAKGNSQNIKILKEYSSESIQTVYLTKGSVMFVNGEKKTAVDTLSEIQQLFQEKIPQKQLLFSMDFAKFNPKFSSYIFQNSHSIFFVCGIRYFKYDLKKREFVNIGFVLKNQRAKLHEVRTSTSSLVYKLNEQYILIEYSNPLKQQQKMVFRTIKSSESDKIISLRKDRWVKVSLKEIVLGEGENQLTTFNMQKMFKTLLQQNSYFEYDLHWTTHGGMILAVKNYLFFLQITQGQSGSQIHLIKKGHSYLHRRFSSTLKTQQHISIVDSRHLVIYTGNRLIRLNNQVESYVTENPYEIPDTLLNRQLKMREYFSPHHPSVVNAMLENGWVVEIVKVMEKVLKWVREEGRSVMGLYERIRIEDYYQKREVISDIEERDEYGEVIVKKPQVRNQSQEIQVLTKLCEHILSQSQQFLLPQNNTLLLQNLLRAVIFQLQNARSFDFFSQTVITKYRLAQNKSKNFTTMDVALLIHSINKDQALEFLKGQDHKMEWQWVQKYSIALWYEPNVEKWRKWIEEIAMTQFRVNKDPFDCLFWYVLAGKKNLLVTLFKAQKFSSKEHDAMHTFLLRDFEDPKHRTAAVKNAYALIDKKRYMHAMAFLLLADKKEECVRFAIDRLNDLNLGYLIHLLSYTTSKAETNQVSKSMIEKGDVWAQHIGWVIQKKHVASYNVLLKDGNATGWQYQPQVKGFHPSVVEFAQKIKQSIPYKRQLQAKNNPIIETSPSLNFDHLNFDMDSFDMQPPSTQSQTSQTSNTQAQTQPKEPQFYNNFYDILQQLPSEQENGFKRALKQKSVKHYMRYHIPCLGLALVSLEDNPKLYVEVKRAYELEKYILTGELSESVVEIAQELQDVMGLLKNDIQVNDYQQILRHLIEFRQKFQSALRKIKINQLNPPSKYQIAQLLHYSFISEQIFTQLQTIIKYNQLINTQLKTLSKANNLGKVICGICLKVYSEMGKSLQAFKENIFIQSSDDFWKVCKEKYDLLVVKKKEKHQKLMDVFESALNVHIRREKDDQHLDFNIRMPKSSTMSVLLWRRIFEFLLKGNDEYMRDQIQELKLRLDKIVTYWVEKDYIDEIEGEISILISEGVEYRLKLNVLSEEFKERQLDTIGQLLKLVYSMRELKQIEDKKNSQQINVRSQIQSKKQKESMISKQSNGNDQKGAIEIFKNKSDLIKGFTLNANDGKGLEVVVLFKKTMRKFQAVDNLVNRDRTKEGYNLIHQDTAYPTDPIDLPQQQLILSKSHLPLIQQTLKTLFSSRNLYDSQQLIKRSEKYTHHLNDYLKPAQVPHQIDFNEIHSIQAHSSLPIYFLGGKGLIEVCRFDTVKSYNRILCPGIAEILKIISVGQRLYLLDKEGSFSCFIFDWTFAYKPIFQLKKMNIIDFACSTPSQFGCITSNSFQYYDTLLHPKRQCIFKIQMSTPPVSISCLSPTQFVILRKQQVQVYDISKGQLMESYNIQGRGRSLYVDRAMGQNYAGRIIVGRGDCKVKVIDLEKKSQSTVRVGNVQEQKEKVFIEVIKKFGQMYFCFRNDGSIYCFSD